MSQITSSTYPVTTTSADGDLFVIVRDGQLMKMNRAALDVYVSTLLQTASTATTADLIDAGSDANTADKFTGKRLFNTTTNKPVYAAGPAATSVWVDATGATAHTPS